MLFPNLEPSQFDWNKDEETKTLYPILLPAGTRIAPDEIMRSVRCSCKAPHCATDVENKVENKVLLILHLPGLQ